MQVKYNLSLYEEVRVQIEDNWVTDTVKKKSYWP